MAVVRQNTQVFNQPIGVVRANAGASEIGAAISEAAGRASDLIYREGAIRAEQVGEKAGIAQPASKIVAINPSTGLPEAYAAPTGFGRIASRSYQSMIDRRFEDSVLDEMKMRGQEIAADAGSANEFRTRMTSYVEQMYANAVDEGGQLNAYGRLIEEAGTAYVSSTFTALRNKEIAAAKEALERQQKYALWVQDRQTTAAITAGADFEDVMMLVGDKRQRAEDLFASGAISFSTFESQMKDADGFEVLAANRELVSAYNAMTPLERSEFKVGIQNPAVLADLAARTQNPNLQTLTLMSLTGTSASSLISSLDSFASARSEYQENLLDTAVADFPISVFTTTADIRAAASAIPEPDIRADFIAEVAATMVLSKADMSIEDVTDLDALSNELLKQSGMNRAVIEGILGADATSAIFSMSADERAGLEKQLSDRRQSLNRIGDEQTRQVVNDLGAEIRSVMQSDDPTQMFEALTAKIEAANIEPSRKNELDGVLSGAVSARFIGLADEQPSGSIDEFTAVINAVTTNQPNGLNETQMALFELYRPAYELQSATVDAAMSRRLDGIKGQAVQKVKSVELTGIKSALDKQQALLPEQLELVDKTLLANVNTINDLVASPDAMKVMLTGSFTPKIKALLGSAVASTDEETIATATQLFESLSRISGRTSFNEQIEIDLMRPNLDPGVYASYAAASYAGRKRNTSPALVMTSIRNYEGGIAGIDAALKARLDVAQSKPLSAVLDDYSMSPNYKAEVLSMLRAMEATGQNVSPDTIDGWVSDYEENSIRDDSIVGFKVGDQTIYGLRNYLSAQEIVDHRNALTDLMAQDDRLKVLLKGGTLADATIATALNALFPSVLTQGEAVIQQFRRGWDASAELNDEARLRAGLSALNIQLKYKPNEAAFKSGMPSWFVGYEQGGMFQMIEINDEPYMLEKQFPSAESPMASAYNRLIVATNAGADSQDIARATIEYWATLPHMDQIDPVELEKLNRMLPERNALELFKAAREGTE